MPTNHFTS